MDNRSGDQLAFCGSRCAYTCGAQHLVGQLKCSLPGCNDFTMLHDRTMVDMGYCCDYHRIKAEERNLVSEGLFNDEMGLQEKKWFLRGRGGVVLTLGAARSHRRTVCAPR